MWVIVDELVILVVDKCQWMVGVYVGCWLGVGDSDCQG